MEPKKDISRAAKNRLKWMEHYEKFRSARLTCRHFGISPDTFYLWKRRYQKDDPSTLEDDTHSRKPKTKKRARWNMEHILLIERLIEINPRTDIQGVRLFLAKNNVQVSISTVYRMVNLLKKMNM